jgi:hypothetical protein
MSIFISRDGGKVNDKEGRERESEWERSRERSFAGIGMAMTGKVIVNIATYFACQSKSGKQMFTDMAIKIRDTSYSNDINRCIIVLSCEEWPIKSTFLSSYRGNKFRSRQQIWWGGYSNISNTPSPTASSPRPTTLVQAPLRTQHPPGLMLAPETPPEGSL